MFFIQNAPLDRRRRVRRSRKDGPRVPPPSQRLRVKRTPIRVRPKIDPESRRFIRHLACFRTFVLPNLLFPFLFFTVILPFWGIYMHGTVASELEFSTWTHMNTSMPTTSPSRTPTISPTTSEPTYAPSDFPTMAPSPSPTDSPTPSPTSFPTTKPTSSPTPNPTLKPSEQPTKKPTKKKRHRIINGTKNSHASNFGSSFSQANAFINSTVEDSIEEDRSELITNYLVQSTLNDTLTSDSGDISESYLDPKLFDSSDSASEDPTEEVHIIEKLKSVKPHSAEEDMSTTPPHHHETEFSSRGHSHSSDTDPHTSTSSKRHGYNKLPKANTFSVGNMHRKVVRNMKEKLPTLHSGLSKPKNARNARNPPTNASEDSRLTQYTPPGSEKLHTPTVKHGSKKPLPSKNHPSKYSSSYERIEELRKDILNLEAKCQILERSLGESGGIVGHSIESDDIPTDLDEMHEMTRDLEHSLSKLAEKCILLAMQARLMPKMPQTVETAMTHEFVFESHEVANQYDMSNWGVKRLLNSPVVYPGMFNSSYAGSDINGPSVIRVPDWVHKPLGKYYMYFAHHVGKHIRLAYTDDIEGDWKLWRGRIMHVATFHWEFKVGHLASPDVHIDEENKKIIMYFHASIRGVQMTYVATSDEGKFFNAQPQILANFYLRVLKKDGLYYGLAKRDFNKTHSTAELLVAERYDQTFRRIKDVLPQARHTTWLETGGSIYVIYSRLSDFPEHLRVANVNPKDWTFEDRGLLLKPEMTYECADFPVIVSKIGKTKKANGLRDPYAFVDKNKIYLFYSVCGEHGIGVARIASIAMD